MAPRKNKHIGSSLDDFLKDQGVLEEFEAAAIKRVIAWQIAKEMKNSKITKVSMAERMKTSRAQLDRLLDPDDGNVTIETLHRAASALGRRLEVQLTKR
jgi:antitoxin HicB